LGQRRLPLPKFKREKKGCKGGRERKGVLEDKWLVLLNPKFRGIFGIGGNRGVLLHFGPNFLGAKKAISLRIF